MADPVKTSCSRWVDDVAEAAKDVDGGGAVAQLRTDLDSAFADERVRVVVCGEFKTGKSTLVNALLSAPGLLPVDVLPCTSYLTVIENAPAARFATVREGVAGEISRQEFLGLTAAREGDTTIERIEVGSPDVWPGEPMVFVDTPGIEDLSKARTDLTLSYVPNADVVILVVDAVQGVKATVVDFARANLSSGRKVIAVMTQTDRLNAPSDVSRRLDAQQRALAVVLPDVTWIPTCAFEGGRKDEGVATLRSAILDVARRERTSLIVDRFIRQARQRIEDLGARLAAEEAGLGMDDGTLEQRIAELRSQAAEADRRNEGVFREASTAMESGFSAWVTTVRERLERFVEEVVAEVEQLDGINAVRQFVTGDVLERRLAAEVRGISNEFPNQMQRLIEGVGRGIFTGRLEVPGGFQVGPEGLVPQPEGLLMKVPEVVWQALEVGALDYILHVHLVPALLIRLGLGKLLKGFPLLRTLMPSNFIRDQLVDTVKTMLAPLPDQAGVAIQEEGRKAIDHLIEQVRKVLDNDVLALEAGLEAARIEMKRGREEALRRRDAISVARGRLAALQAALAGLTA